jgi:large subunit ribosomal protein L9
MEVILKEDIKGLGFKNDTVSVKPGYGRNYLIPQGLALTATTSNRKVVAENVKQAAHKAEKIKNDALALVEKIGNITLEIKQKVGENGKIFGKITSLQISDALAAKGITVDRKRISFKEEEVKSVGTFTAVILLHKEVSHEIKFEVIAE